MSRCQLELKAAGVAYPRTCPTCGLSGACVKGLSHGTPERPPLVASPEVQALIREAEARGMERAADHVVATCPTGMDAADLIDAHHDIAAAIRAEAAAIRGDTE